MNNQKLEYLTNLKTRIEKSEFLLSLFSDFIHYNNEEIPHPGTLLVSVHYLPHRHCDSSESLQFNAVSEDYSEHIVSSFLNPTEFKKIPNPKAYLRLARRMLSKLKKQYEQA